jgi:hypothetical protein
VRKEAAWFACNVCNGGTMDHVRQMVQGGIVDSVVALLQDPDPDVIHIALDTIIHMFKRAEEEEGDTENEIAAALEGRGCVEALEALQQYDDEDVYAKTVDLLENFFGTEDVADDALEPPTVVSGGTSGRAQFGFGFDNGGVGAPAGFGDASTPFPFSFGSGAAAAATEGEVIMEADSDNL